MIGEKATSNGDNTLEFEGSIELEGSKDEIWRFISDPENLLDCVPGAREIERHSKREYTFTIEKEIGFFSAVFDGDAELVEMNEPRWIVANGSAYDQATGSTFDVLAAMEMTETDRETVELVYNADVTFTGGVAKHGAKWIRRVIDWQVEEYFGNIQTEFESTPQQERSQSFS